MADQTSSKQIKEIKRLIRLGEVLRAYDLAISALEEYPDNQALQYQACLALARSGATQKALDQYKNWELNLKENCEDVKALKGRLEKDYALAHQGQERLKHFIISAETYFSIYQNEKNYYPGINAATCFFLGGEGPKAKSIAQEVFDGIKSPSNSQIGDAYYREATRAEALILLERYEEARESLRLAKTFIGEDFASVSTTRKQLHLICPEEYWDIIEELKNPTVAHYSGHMISKDGRFIFEEENRIREEIRTRLDENNVGFGFGSLACGADILFAECLIESGAKLEVVLPFDKDEFIETSVRSAGDNWVERFHRVIDAADQVMFASEDQYLNDDSLYNYCAQLAMGQTLLRSEFLEAEALQIAVWDGLPPSGVAGTSVDVHRWAQRGKRQIFIKTKSFVEPVENYFSAPLVEKTAQGERRVLKAILFGDVKGFSKLKEAQIPPFVEEIMGRFAIVLEEFHGQVEFVNTWGDGIFIVLPDVLIASKIATRLQETLEEFIADNPQFASHSLRLGAHYGPVVQKFDPVLKRNNYFGVHISRAARVEPVTPVGEVYATWPFASEITLLNDDSFKVQYVGHLPAAKSYGRLRMYVLRKT